MRRTKFTLPAAPSVDFSVSFVDLDARSPLNHNESHIHRECEIYLNLSGDVSFEVENRLYPVTRGTVILTRPYEYHHCVYHSDAPHNHYWVTFSAQGTEEHLKLFFQREKGRDNRVLLEGGALEEMIGLLDMLLDPETDPLDRQIGFLRVFRVLARGSREGDTEAAPDLPETVTAALRHMDAHLAESLDIRTVSRGCGVSVNTLERHFRASLGISPSAMLRKKRLIASMEVLRNGGSVSEAAMRYGFSDDSGYIQHFRRQFGMTPLQYKKLFRVKAGL